MKKNKYEDLVINPIINFIKDNQTYLSKKENLPQLCKLGYLYGLLWYAGRNAYGYEGLVSRNKSPLII